MTLTTGTLPYDVANLLSGAARVLISDDSVALPAVPANVTDVFDAKSPYAAKAGWVDIGATADATSYTRDMSAQEYTIEQSQAPVFEDITEVNRTLRVQMAEFDMNKLKIMEGEGTTGTVAAVATVSAPAKTVKFGSVNNLKKRRVAFVGQRNPLSGTVHENTAALDRGRFVMFVLYNVLISADSTEISIGKGNLASGPVSFKAYPESGLASGVEFGIWVLEDAGTI